MTASFISIGLLGLQAYKIIVEADVSSGLPAFDIVGLPGTAVKESRERVRAALKNSGVDFPHVRVTVNLAPADVEKDSPVYDLPTLLAIASAAGECPEAGENAAFVGELSLSGSVRPVGGVLAMAAGAAELGIKRLYVPKENAEEAALIPGLFVYAVETVSQLFSLLRGEREDAPVTCDLERIFQEAGGEELSDFSAINGQEGIKRALEIAAAGGHNLLMIGPAGAGKSLMAKALPSILPPMTIEESLETTKIHSVAGRLKKGHPLVKTRPFCAPHHTVSAVSLAGGGTNPKPGEVSAAHNGVLFLDELPEFSRQTLEVLRQPLEDGCITVSRIKGTVTFPSRITLVCAMNPCRCGNFGSGAKRCVCTQQDLRKYRSKLSGPLLDRLDLIVDVQPVSFTEMSEGRGKETSREIRIRVETARKLAAARLRPYGFYCNAQMPHSLVKKLCVPSEEAGSLLKNAFSSLQLSARSYDKILKVARTIADLSNHEPLEAEDIAEAIYLRSAFQKYWPD